MLLRRSSAMLGAVLLAAIAMVPVAAVAQTDTVLAPDPSDPGRESGDALSGEPGTVVPGQPTLDLALHYKTVFSIGDNDDGDLAGLIDESSQLRALEDKPTATYTGLARRADGDVERLVTVLRSEGYYDGTVTYAIDDKKTPATVTVTVSPGARYHLAAYDIAWTGGKAPDGVALSPGLDIGMPAESKPIADAQVRLLDALKRQGRPFAKVADRVVRIDRSDKTMHVTLTLDAGPPATFGPTTIAGLTDLDPAFVRGKIPWHEGERYDQSKLEALRTTLLTLGLFGSVKVEHATAPGPDGRLPITLTLKESTHRSVGAGASYSTSEGFLLDVFWEHRNLLGAAEKLRLSGTVGSLSQSAKADFRKPDFWRVDQDLVANTALVRTNSDAYDETTLSNYLGLDRKLSETWRAAAGGTFELSRITDQDSSNTVQLFGVPLTATRDSRDDVLNPTKGSVLGFELVPYTGHSDQTLTFALGRVSASSYIALDRRRRYVLAGRTRIASLVGEETTNIPANKRLYAGGGGSIRGYGYQRVGPLDPDNDPLGGSSLFELGLEARLRVTEDIGVVPFVDGGNVWSNQVPQLLDRMQWAAGLGLRYYTAIGPARVDFAVPINKRDGIDSDFQLYFSLGQAF